ncbi:MAG: radical SAM protein [Spirochaetia bacterium]
MENIFGPVPSRRLGRSIGINNIPPKVCSYSCVYCQLGRAIEMAAERRGFYDPAELTEAAGRRVDELREKGERIDYLTIVPDGEPTLDIHLGELIEGLRRFEIPVALISNGSLMANPALREELRSLDWLSIKVDAADEESWRRIDRPHKQIDFDRMRGGIKFLADTFKGVLTTETMLVKRVNDSREEIDAVAGFIETLEPVKAYISIPTRPPAETWVSPADEESIAYAYGKFASVVPFVENLTGYEGNEFTASGDARSDLLSITAVHPMRRDAVEALLERDGAEIDVLYELLHAEELVEVKFEGSTYYVRKLRT